MSKNRISLTFEMIPDSDQVYVSLRDMVEGTVFLNTKFNLQRGLSLLDQEQKTKLWVAVEQVHADLTKLLHEPTTRSKK